MLASWGMNPLSIVIISIKNQLSHAKNTFVNENDIKHDIRRLSQAPIPVLAAIASTSSSAAELAPEAVNPLV